VLMVQVKSGSARASHVEKEILKIWGAAFGGSVEVWRYRKGKPLEKEVVYKRDL
jgi:hypothetical protein